MSLCVQAERMLSLCIRKILTDLSSQLFIHIGVAYTVGVSQYRNTYILSNMFYKEFEPLTFNPSHIFITGKALAYITSGLKLNKCMLQEVLRS